MGDPTTPNQEDYLAFLYGVVGIPDKNLLATDPIIATTLELAQSTVNDTLVGASPTLSTLAVYNLAADRLINFAQDVDGQTYFKDLRKDLRLLDVSVGVVSSSGDQGTATGILNPEAMKTFTLQDLQTLKTPYGRAYMGFAQAYGPSLWGLT